MASNQKGENWATSNNLSLRLLRQGCGLVAFGLFFGFAIPLAPYPRLALTAHIQFVVEGTMVLAAGLLLQSTPFLTTTSTSSKETKVSRARVEDRLSKWQKTVILWGCMGIWVTLLAEAANAWWGTEWVLTIAHEAAGLKGTQSAERWMEIVVWLTHMPPSAILAVMVSALLTLVSKIFDIAREIV